MQTNTSLVLGAGSTGLSCLRYLDSKGLPARLYDDAVSEKKLGSIKAISSDISVFDRKSNQEEIFDKVQRVLVSPGIPLSHPIVELAKNKALELIGDVELFARDNDKPVLAVTGSNAKSTVVTLVHAMLEEDGRSAALAGNIGKPVLEALLQNKYEIYVLELSSFQLDSIKSLKTKVSCVLNVSPDHMDRYDSFEAYADSKRSIYHLAEVVVFNRDDQMTEADKFKSDDAEVLSFGLSVPVEKQYGLLEEDGKLYLCRARARKNNLCRSISKARKV
jgi:UDP-N-acetylmuramoylalanine--D-glutamate ligase